MKASPRCPIIGRAKAARVFSETSTGPGVKSLSCGITWRTSNVQPAFATFRHGGRSNAQRSTPRNAALARKCFAWHRHNSRFSHGHPIANHHRSRARDPSLLESIQDDDHRGAGLLVLGGLGYAGYELYTARQASDADALLAARQIAAGLSASNRSYPGSEPAASACLLLAAQQRAKKNYAEANTTLHKFIEQFPKHELITTAWMGVAANLESLGKNDEALSTYQRLATEYPQSFNAPLALLAQVPFLKAKNRIEEARRVCETVMTQYRDSIVANEAVRELMSLPRPAAPAPTAPQPQPPSRWPDRRSPSLPPPHPDNRRTRPGGKRCLPAQRKRLESLPRSEKAPRQLRACPRHRQRGALQGRITALRELPLRELEPLARARLTDFFRSFIRGSRRSNPSAFNVPRRFASTCRSAREIASRAAPA